VCYDYHCIYVREGHKLDVSLGESYLHVRPFGSHDRAFDCHVIDLAVVFMFLSFVFNVEAEASGDSVDGSEGWEIGVCFEDSWFCGRGGGGLGSVFGWVV
jgi:hypothetical protein